MGVYKALPYVVAMLLLCCCYVVAMLLLCCCRETVDIYVSVCFFSHFSVRCIHTSLQLCDDSMAGYKARLSESDALPSDTLELKSTGDGSSPGLATISFLFGLGANRMKW